MSGETQKIFFSYARGDSEFVLKLATELRAAGADLWVDQLDIPAGRRWDRAVEEALEVCPRMLVVLSPDAVDSHNVMDEVSYALEERKQVIPVLHHSCKIPFRLRRVQYVDFTGDYDRGFAQLLRDLGIEQVSVVTVPSEPEAAEEPVAEAPDPSQEQAGVASHEVEEDTGVAAEETFEIGEPEAVADAEALEAEDITTVFDDTTSSAEEYVEVIVGTERSRNRIAPLRQFTKEAMYDAAGQLVQRDAVGDVPPGTRLMVTKSYAEDLVKHHLAHYAEVQESDTVQVEDDEEHEATGVGADAPEAVEEPVAERQEAQPVAPPEAPPEPEGVPREQQPVASKPALAKKVVATSKAADNSAGGIERQNKKPKWLALVGGGVVIVLILIYALRESGLPCNDFASIPGRSWAMGKCEVMQGQWKAVMGTEPWKEEAYVREGDDDPAVYVSWDEAQAFIEKLNAQDSLYHYRLPTEEEWEYACRAESTTEYSFGDDAAELGEYAWYRDNAGDAGERYAHRVGQKKANAWGLYDIHGNVWQWTETTKTGSDRVIRGGSWSLPAGRAVSADYEVVPSDYRYIGLGFRLLRTGL